MPITTCRGEMSSCLLKNAHSQHARQHELPSEINWHFSLQFSCLIIYHFLLCPLGTCVIDQERFNTSTLDCLF